ncbi:MAG: PKD domain-containing protein [Thermoplasmata archaeon]|nr:PKD domain-containing protein [Thermoplasmata archaeon]
MQFDNRIIAIMAIALMAIAVPGLAASADADQEYTRDYGEFYSYTLQFVFDGSEAQTIDWDFGDGTEHSTEWNPRHTYASTGTYYVTQTTTNTQGTTTEVYKVQIMGFPVVSFDTNGGSSISPIQMEAYNQTLAKPADPTRSGYTFAGWFYDAAFVNAVDWTAGITKSMTLYAKWTQNETPTVTYSVVFDSNGGSTVTTQTVNSGSTVTTQPADPTRSGYTFNGWYLGSAKYVFSTPVTGNITLVAHWTENAAPIVYRTVSFDENGGSVAVSSQSVASGTEFTVPAYSGTRTGYEFSGWSYNSTTYQPGQSISVTQDIVLKAVWRSTAPVVSSITVTFDVNGGSKTVAAQTIQSSSTFTFPSYDGTKDGCRFAGWALGLLTYQPGQSVQLTGNVTVKAIWDAESDDSKDIIVQIEDFVKEHIILTIVIVAIIILATVLAMTRRRY